MPNADDAAKVELKRCNRCRRSTIHSGPPIPADSDHCQPFIQGESARASAWRHSRRYNRNWMKIMQSSTIVPNDPASHGIALIRSSLFWEKASRLRPYVVLPVRDRRKKSKARPGQSTISWSPCNTPRIKAPYLHTTYPSNSCKFEATSHKDSTARSDIPSPSQPNTAYWPHPLAHPAPGPSPTCRSGTTRASRRCLPRTRRGYSACCAAMGSSHASGPRP